MIREIKTITNASLISEFKAFPNQGILWEIIETNQTGKIFELSTNAILVIENRSDPFVFIAGMLTNETVSDVISFVSALKFPGVCCHAKYHPLFLKHGWNFYLRAEFSLKNSTKAVAISQETDIRPINTLDIFKKCSWYKETSELYGSDENFLAHGTGYALFIGSEVVSEAYANIGGGYAEISIITHPDYRGKGYAAQIVSHLIKQCIEAKITPKWSCSVNNRASFYTSLKAGFEVSGYDTFLVPKARNGIC